MAVGHCLVCLGKIQELVLTEKAVWRTSRSGHPAARGSPWGDTCKGAERPRYCPPEDREIWAPCWVGMDDKPENGCWVWPNSLRPVTAGAHLPVGERQRNPTGVPQSCIFNIVCIFGAHLPYGRVLCFVGTYGGTLGPSPSGAGLGRRASLLCLEGRAWRPHLA